MKLRVLKSLVIAICAGLFFVALPVLAAPSPANEAPIGNPKSLELNEQGAAAVKAKDFRLAEDLFRRALAADTKNLTAAYNLAGMYLINKKDGEAILLLKEYTTSFPGDVGLFARLGDAYFSTKDIKNAAASYERAFAIDPAYEGVAAKLSTVYALLNRMEDAEKLLLKAVEINPQDGQSLANLSSIYVGNGKPDRAVSTAKRALQVKPTKDVYVTLGTAYEMMKDYKNSLIAFERAKALAGKDPEIDEKIANLKKLTS